MWWRSLAARVGSRVLVAVIVGLIFAAWGAVSARADEGPEPSSSAVASASASAEPSAEPETPEPSPAGADGGGVLVVTLDDSQYQPVSLMLGVLVFIGGALLVVEFRR